MLRELDRSEKNIYVRFAFTYVTCKYSKNFYNSNKKNYVLQLNFQLIVAKYFDIKLQNIKENM